MSCAIAPPLISNATMAEDTLQANALLEAIRLVTILSLMDNDKYEESLTDTTSCTESPGAGTIQSQLDDIQQTWRLEGTSLSRLIHSVHRWQSFATQAAKETVHHGQEIQTAQHQLVRAEARITELEDALQKLHSKNRKLKSKLSVKKAENKSLMRSVKRYLKHSRKVDEEIDQRIVSQLQSHERIMRLEATLRREEGNRSRTSSRDSTFSDAHSLTDPRYFGDLDESLYSSASSVSSLVTDDGVATVSLTGNGRGDKEGTADDTFGLVVRPEQSIRIQVVQVGLEKRKGALDDIFEESGTTSNKEQATNPFHLNVNFGLHRRAREGLAYLVCGHEGSDELYQQSLPTLGNRLVSINGHTVLEEKDIRFKASEPVHLVFKRQEMTTKQSSIISKAAEALQSNSETSRKTNNFFKLEIVEVPRDTMPKLHSLMSFQHEMKPQQQQQKQKQQSQIDIGSELDAPADTTNSPVRSMNLGAHTSEKLGNAMKAMGRPFKSLF